MRELLSAAAAVLCAWSTVRAQAGDGPTQRALTISLGVAQETRRDDTDSPLAYSGAGPAGQIAFDWTRAARHGYVSLSASEATITPRVSPAEADVPPEEAFNSYAFEAGMDWRFRGGSARAGEFALGAEFGATFTLARHMYAGQDLSQQNFDLGVATLGPVARWTRRVGAGDFTASLGVPLIAFVDHPYADVRYATQLMNIHFVPLSQFHQANAGLSYAFRPESRIGVTATYRVGIMELDDLEPVRRVAQSLSVGVVKRFGARP